MTTTRDLPNADAALEELFPEFGVEPTNSGSSYAPGPINWDQSGAVIGRAIKYLEKMPIAVDGNNGSAACFRVACVLRKEFALSIDESLEAIRDWNAACKPPWSEKELRHKLDGAGKVSGPSGYLRQTKPEAWQSVKVPEYPEPVFSLQFFDAWDASFNPRPHKQVIIEGMLRRGEVGNVIAATKAGKSWLALQLLMKVATGTDWLGRRVSKGRCLLIDNEIQRETLDNRLAAVRRELQIDDATERSPFECLPLRGEWKSLTDLAVVLPQRYQPGDLTLIVLDAKYRFFSGDGMEENSNDAQTKFHNAVDALAADLDCGVLMVHHATKGDQSGKSVVDMGSGGGAQARAADLHCVLRDHELPGHAVLNAAVRSFPPVEPQTLRYDWPLWSVVSGVSPQVAKPKERGDIDKMRKKIETHLKDEWQSLSSFAERCGTKHGRETFMNIIESMQAEGLLELRDDFKPPHASKNCDGVRRTVDSSLGTVSADSV